MKSSIRAGTNPAITLCTTPVVRNQPPTTMANRQNWASDHLVKLLVRNKSECTPQTHNNNESNQRLSNKEQLAIAREARKVAMAKRKASKAKREAWEKQRGVQAIGTFYLQNEVINEVKQFAKDHKLSRTEAIRTLLIIGLNANAQGE